MNPKVLLLELNIYNWHSIFNRHRSTTSAAQHKFIQNVIGELAQDDAYELTGCKKQITGSCEHLRQFIHFHLLSK